MTELNLDHPAVEAAAASYARTSPARTDALEDMSAARREQFMRRTHQALTSALPHLTADDLRNTPAGRELMAEAWEDGALHQARGSAETLRVLASALPNPYKETPNE